jgi:hypothetical protein
VLLHYDTTHPTIRDRYLRNNYLPNTENLEHSHSFLQAQKERVLGQWGGEQHALLVLNRHHVLSLVDYA